MHPNTNADRKRKSVAFQVPEDSDYEETPPPPLHKHKISRATFPVDVRCDKCVTESVPECDHRCSECKENGTRCIPPPATSRFSTCKRCRLTKAKKGCSLTQYFKAQKLLQRASKAHQAAANAAAELSSKALEMHKDPVRRQPPHPNKATPRYVDTNSDEDVEMDGEMDKEIDVEMDSGEAIVVAGPVEVNVKEEGAEKRIKQEAEGITSDQPKAKKRKGTPPTTATPLPVMYDLKSMAKVVAPSTALPAHPPVRAVRIFSPNSLKAPQYPAKLPIRSTVPPVPSSSSRLQLETTNDGRNRIPVHDPVFSSSRSFATPPPSPTETGEQADALGEGLAVLEPLIVDALAHTGARVTERLIESVEERCNSIVDDISQHILKNLQPRIDRIAERAVQQLQPTLVSMGTHSRQTRSSSRTSSNVPSARSSSSPAPFVAPAVSTELHRKLRIHSFLFRDSSQFDSDASQTTVGNASSIEPSADLQATVSGLQEELHQLRLGLNQDRQEIADSVARTQAIELALHTETDIQKLIHQSLHQFEEGTLLKYVKKEDLVTEVSSAGFAKSGDLATKDDIARFNPLIEWMRIFSARTLESMTGLSSQIADNRERVVSLERLAVSTLTHHAMQANIAELVSYSSSLRKDIHPCYSTEKRYPRTTLT